MLDQLMCKSESVAKVLFLLRLMIFPFIDLLIIWSKEKDDLITMLEKKNENGEKENEGKEYPISWLMKRKIW